MTWIGADDILAPGALLRVGEFLASHPDCHWLAGSGELHFVTEGRKSYRFTVRWGVETDTDDAEGRTIATTDARPTRAEVEAVLPAFTGAILQTPPTFSAIKIAGERAYDLARDGEIVEIEPRPVTINSLELVESTEDTATLEAQCGKGTYVRSIARDLGRMLGCYGHVVALRRTRVGPFTEADLSTFADLEESADAAVRHMRSVEAGLSELPCVVIDRNNAARLRRGQSILLRGRDAPAEGLRVYAACDGEPVAFGQVEAGELVPARVFNLGA